MMRAKLWRHDYFESEKVAHCQYVSKFGSEETGSLDFCLIIYYKRVCRKRYFDFGISNVDKGKN
jgi:hypothetical protein